MRPQREMIAQLSGEEAMVVAMPRLLANEPLWPSAASTWSFVQRVATRCSPRCADMGAGARCGQYLWTGALPTSQVTPGDRSAAMISPAQVDLRTGCRS